MAKTWKVTTLALVDDGFGYYMSEAMNCPSEIEFCGSEIERLFLIPKTAKRIWLIGSNKFSKEAVLFRMRKTWPSWSLINRVRWSSRGAKIPCTGFYDSTNQWLLANLPWPKNNILKVWVTVEYEE